MRCLICSSPYVLLKKRAAKRAKIWTCADILCPNCKMDKGENDEGKEAK